MLSLVVVAALLSQPIGDIKSMPEDEIGVTQVFEGTLSVPGENDETETLHVGEGLYLNKLMAISVAEEMAGLEAENTVCKEGLKETQLIAARSGVSVLGIVAAVFAGILLGVGSTLFLTK